MERSDIAVFSCMHRPSLSQILALFQGAKGRKERGPFEARFGAHLEA
jgi:hypothetical protein